MNDPQNRCPTAPLPDLSLTQAPTPRPRTVERLRVLVVDDEIDIQHAVRRVFRHNEVVTASTGAEALAILCGDEHFDAVVCDVSMPGMNGAELFAAVEAIRPEVASRFVFLTGSVLRDPLGSSSAVLVMEKPFDNDQLRLAVLTASRR